MKSSDQISTKVLSATLLISLISASQSEACGNSKNNSFSAIAEACAAAIDGVKADGKTDGIVKVTKLNQPEAAVVSLAVLYNENGIEFPSSTLGSLVSKCHVLAVAHAMPHPVVAYEKGKAQESLDGGPDAKRPIFNPFKATIDEVNEKMKFRVAIVSETDTRGYSVMKGEVVGKIQPNGTQRLGSAQDLMLIRLSGNVGGITPIELDRNKLDEEDAFAAKTLTVESLEGGFNTKRMLCKGMLPTSKSFSEVAEGALRHNCKLERGNSGGQLTRVTTVDEPGPQRDVLSGMIVTRTPGLSAPNNIYLSTAEAVYISSHVGRIEQWMHDYPCEN